MNDDVIPSCRYFRDRPCERPRKCPVHGLVLRRPKLKWHLLREKLEAFSWHPNGPFRPRTVCGLFLHAKTDLEAEIAKLVGDSAAPDAHWKAYNEVSERADYWTSPIPSTDPCYEVFYQVGWESSREVLVVKHNPTCRRCQVAVRISA